MILRPNQQRQVNVFSGERVNLSMESMVQSELSRHTLHMSSICSYLDVTSYMMEKSNNRSKVTKWINR